jgi:hypothetical protein
MALYLLPWNPDAWRVGWIWKSPDEYDQLVRETKTHRVADSYQVWINRKTIQVGDEVVLFQTGPKPDLRGLYGWGLITGAPHPYRSGGKIRYGIDVKWIRCLEYKHHISVDLLQRLVPEIDWQKGHQCSAPSISDPAAQKLRVLWKHWLIFGPPSQ